MKTDTKFDILIVDDNQNLLITLSDLLTFEGFSVRTAESGEEALEKVGTMAPDLIVLDISMPGMGGIGFLRRIAREDGSLRYRVLVLTARSAMETFFQDVAVDGFVAKPCSEQELLGKIREILACGSRRNTEVPNHKDLCILLAEDDPSHADDIRAAFRAQSRPFAITVAEKGPDVLEKALIMKPDLVLIKEYIHGMRGEEVLSLLEMIPKTSSIPAILYSRDNANAFTGVRTDRKDIRCVPNADAWTLARTAAELLNA